MTPPLPPPSPEDRFLADTTDVIITPFDPSMLGLEQPQPALIVGEVTPEQARALLEK